MKASRWRMKLFTANANPQLAAEIAVTWYTGW